MVQYRTSSRQYQRMPHKRTGKECNSDLRHRSIAILPGTSIKRIHKLRLAGENPDRMSAADHLAIRGQIRTNAKGPLPSTWGKSEAGNHLVDNERNLSLLGNLPKRSNKIHRLQTRV